MLVLLLACASDSKLDRVNEAPSVAIAAPLDGTVFRQGVDLIGVVAQVEDSFDPPEALTVTWTADGSAPTQVFADADGQVSFTVDPATLTLGKHLLSVTVVDLDGAGAYTSVGFEVGGPLGPPTVEITAPADGSTFRVGESITFTGAASDTTSGPETLAFEWISDIDGPLEGAISGGGQSALLTSALSPGAHLVTLAVTDEDGELGTDAITVLVEEPPKEPEPPEPGDLIFSELMVNPSVPDEDGEWVELYNTSGSTLDIAGYSFHDDDSDWWVFDASVLVEPHGFVVLCANPDPSRNGGVHCDGWFYRNPDGQEPSAGLGHGAGVAIANNDDELVLTSPDGVDIDIFDYDDTDSDPIEAERSFGLDPNRMDGVSNDTIGYWCAQVTTLEGATDPGTPGQANDPCE